jgi:hypothetical protein
MTTFKEIRGTDILALSSDPANPEIGQIWYNSSSGTLKGYKSINTWSSGGSLGTGRYSLGGFGLQTAAVAVGGYNTVPVTNLTNTENYDGTTWTASGSLATGRRYLSGIGFGTQTAGAVYGGVTNTTLPQTYSTATEKYNGSSWTSSGNLNTGRGNAGNSGIQTAAIVFGGSNATPGGGGRLASVENYNGTSWTNGTSLNTARENLGASGKGSQTATLAFGGYIGPTTTAATESWNGTSWTTVNSLNTARYLLCGAGEQTSALAFGGVNPAGTHQSATELWNGTSWTSNPTGLTTPKASSGGCGTQASALIFGGYTNTSSPFAPSQEWNGVGIQTITVS